jgi:hypothetical protein
MSLAGKRAIRRERTILNVLAIQKQEFSRTDVHKTIRQAGI